VNKTRHAPLAAPSNARRHARITPIDANGIQAIPVFIRPGLLIRGCLLLLFFRLFRGQRIRMSLFGDLKISVFLIEIGHFNRYSEHKFIVASKRIARARHRRGLHAAQ
jgi:hypothetical protein